MKQIQFNHGVWVRICALVVGAGLTAVAHGELFVDQGGGLFTATNSGVTPLPDNDLSGVAFNLSGIGGGTTVSNVTVDFTITGGYNGDLYVYLSHGSDALVLLDRVGVGITGGSMALQNFGYSGGGFTNITLSDSGSVNIHQYDGTTQNVQPTPNGTYLADGQTTSPLASPGSFLAGGGSLTFNSQFFGDDPSGTWTLFFADVSSGSAPILKNWTVSVEVVPEPTTACAAIAFGAPCSPGYAISVVAKPLKLDSGIRIEPAL